MVNLTYGGETDFQDFKVDICKRIIFKTIETLLGLYSPINQTCMVHLKFEIKKKKILS